MPLSINIKERISLLGGLCFFLSLIEYMIPKPLPFIRIGISNMPLILAIDLLPFPGFILLVFLKIIGQALITGTLFSYVFVFSLGATLASSIMMYVMRKLFGEKGISLIGISAAGAMVSNSVQLLLAYFIIFGRSVYYMAVPVYIVGIISGIFLGYICEYFKNNSLWYAGNINAGNNINDGLPKSSSLTEKKVSPSMPKKLPLLFTKKYSSEELALTGFIMLLAFLFNTNTFTRILQAVFFFLLALLSGKKINYLMTFFTMSIIAFFSLLVPYGEILFNIASFRITWGALQSGLNRAFTLTGLLMLSRFCIGRDLSFPGFFGEIISDAFRVFSKMEKIKLNRKDWLYGVDEVLISLEKRHDGQDKAVREIPDKPNPSLKKRIFHTGQLFLVLIIIIAWLPLFIGV